MTSLTNPQILLASRPQAEVRPENFRLVQAPVPPLRDGQVLVRHRWLSLDPYMRGRMGEAKSYAAPQPLGEVMLGGTAGEVVESRHPDFQPGDRVVGMGGWQLYQVVDAAQGHALRKVDDAHVPLQAYLGAVGMPGVTAWYGVNRLLDPQPGQTLVVSAASGAVGGVAGQLAKRRGARAVGIAGGAEKCRYVVDELGFDACIDHRAHADAASLARALREACPQGIDRIFENVGGRVLDAALLGTNAFGRVALCGLIAGYGGEDIAMANPRLILVNRLRIQGFIVSDHPEDWPAALAELGGLVARGELKYRETVAEGLHSAPEAFIGLLQGRNFGKQLVRLG